MAKPVMNLLFRISTECGGQQRFTEAEVFNEIKAANVYVVKIAGNPDKPDGCALLIRKSDRKVIGEFI